MGVNDQCALRKIQSGECPTWVMCVDPRAQSYLSSFRSAPKADAISHTCFLVSSAVSEGGMTAIQKMLFDYIIGA
jgi:hypothetical protein